MGLHSLLGKGKCVAWDVTVADTFANSYLPLTAARAGAAAERAALNKHTKYDNLKKRLHFRSTRVRGHRCMEYGKYCMHSSMTSLREFMLSLVIKERSL